MYDLNDIYEERPMSIENDIRIAGAKAGSNVMHATMIKRCVSSFFIFYFIFFLWEHRMGTMCPFSGASVACILAGYSE